MQTIFALLLVFWDSFAYVGIKGSFTSDFTESWVGPSFSCEVWLDLKEASIGLFFFFFIVVKIKINQQMTNILIM